MDRRLGAATFVVVSAWASASAAQGTPDIREETPDRTATCADLLSEAQVVRCALIASPEVAAARARQQAAGGRRLTAEVWLPSNPTVEGIVAQRRRPAPEAATVLNWAVKASQELEIAGQRGARVDEADADVAASARRAEVVEREVAAGALGAYYDAVGAAESLRFATALAETARGLAVYADARVKEALAPGIEADVARAEAARIGIARLAAERRLAEARAVLALLLDVDPGALVLPTTLPAVSGDAGDAAALERQAIAARSELAASVLERQVLERRLTVVKRSRVPNPTLQAFFERGEINDRIVGGSLSFPLPLPSPLGRTRAGEIAEVVAQIREAESSVALARRRVRVEVARAVAGVRATAAGVAIFDPALLGRARADLASLRDALTSRQLTLREGLQWQRSLIELLQGDIEARLARVQAQIELRRAAGLAFVQQAGGRR
jgi:cobalt-zinc-cadmium efflux system outer membrane protein